MFIIFRIAPILAGSILLISIFASSITVSRHDTALQTDMIPFDVTREPRMGSPRISLVTQNDIVMTINANTIKSKHVIIGSNSIALDLHKPFVEVEFSAGDVVWLSANEGAIDEVDDSMRMEGAVKLWTADGYVATMDQVNSNLKSTYIIGTGNVEGFGPFGDVSSNTVEVFPSKFESGSYFIKFSDNVFVTYTPEETD
jgi:lipopolysaccharide export system protein LptC